MSFTVNTDLLTAFVMVLARTSAWAMLAPPFANRNIPVRVRAGLAVALSVFTVNQIPIPTTSLDTAPFIGALILQIVIGLALGFTCYMLMAAIQMAGGFIDDMAGLTLSQYYDPGMAEQGSVFARYYYQVALVLLFATNAHLILVDGFLRSFKAMPAGGFDVGKFDAFLTQNMGQLAVAAVEISAPVVAVLFLTEIGLGLLSRAAPSLNVFQIGFPIRVVVTLATAGLAIPLVLPALSNLVAKAAGAMAGGG